jgi:hypothetical protein
MVRDLGMNPGCAPRPSCRIISTKPLILDFRAFSEINPSAYYATNPRHINHVPILE